MRPSDKAASMRAASHHQHPREGCAAVMEDSHLLLSAGQKWIILEEQEMEPWLPSAAEMAVWGWQPATCCATILFPSWASSDKLNSSDEGRSGSSTRRCASDSHLLSKPEDLVESYGDGSGSA